MIKFVICGIEHSGTTLVSDLFRQVPEVESGFEVGVLLAKTPREFSTLQPFAKNLLDGWKVSEADLAYCCDTDLPSEFYSRLQEKSGILNIRKGDVFDKTPRYLAQLSACRRKLNLPFIVMYKDPRAIVHSDYMRSKQTNFDEWFESYLEAKLNYMRHLYRQFVTTAESDSGTLTMSLELLCMEPRKSCNALFSHCGYSFKIEYLLLRNLRFAHTRTNSINSRIPFEYLEGFSEAQCRLIRNEFSEFSEWFYD